MTSNLDWREVRIDELKADVPNALTTGPFGSAISSRYFTNEGVPVIRGSNLSEDVGKRLVEDDLAFVSPEKAQELRRSVARKGDLVFTCWGTVGQVGLIDEGAEFDDYLISNKQMKLTPDLAQADSLFLYYAFSAPQFVAQVKAEAIGSSVPGFNLGQLRRFRVLLPPLHEQRAIAAVLGVLDDTIELNARTVRCLDDLFHTCYRARFQGAAAADWPVVRLAELCNTQYGYTTSAREEPVGPRFLRVKDINKSNWVDWSEVPFCQIPEAERARYSLDVGDVVVARMADPGKAAIVEEQVKAIFASYLVRLKATSLPWAYFVYGFLKSPNYARYAEGATSGSVQRNMNARVIVGANVAVPPDHLVDSFLEVTLPLRSMMTTLVRESATLRSLRDLLLPKLISGQLRARDAEAVAESAR